MTMHISLQMGMRRERCVGTAFAIMPSGPLVRLVLTFGPDTPKSERYKDGDSWYKTVLEIEWQSGIIVPCETVNRHLAGPHKGAGLLCVLKS